MTHIQSVSYEELVTTPDFSFFVTKPIIPSDVILSNGLESWAFHKVVLRKISPVFADLLDGDNTLAEIKLEGVPSETLTIFQKFVYTRQRERVKLLRDRASELKEAYEISGAPVEEWNGVYKQKEDRTFPTYVRQYDGKTYQLGKNYSFYEPNVWVILRTDVTPNLKYCVSRAAVLGLQYFEWKDQPKEWKNFVPQEKHFKMKVTRNLSSSNFPFTNEVITGLHTIIAKYNLRLPHLKAYLKWMYSYHWSPNITEFSTLVEDAREKGLNDIANIALTTQLENFDFCSAAEYPIWFQKEALQKHEKHAKYATILGVVSKRAMQEDNVEIMSIVQKSLSTKSLEFKGRVLDVQLQAHKKRKLE